MRFFSVLFLLLLSCTGFAGAQPLPSDQAFVLSASVQNPNTALLTWQMPKGYFLYRDRLSIVVTPGNDVNLGSLQLPIGQIKQSPVSGELQIYRNQLNLPVSVLAQTSGISRLSIHYQGCTDAGFCYPPVQKQLILNFDDHLALREVNLETAKPHTIHDNEWSDSKKLLASSNTFIALLSFWFLGLLLSFTPCILPMLPVLSGIIAGQGSELSTRRAFLLSCTYVLGMSITYAIAGVVIASLGANLQTGMQNPLIICTFGLFFVILSLSMFGLFELRLPIKLQAKFHQLSHSKQGGTFLGTALMGALSTLILSPCVTPPLVGVLSYVASNGNIFFGGAALFFLSIGMGTPLLLIGTSAGRWLPKAGHWMAAVKHIIGILLLAVAITLFARILPGPFILFLWSCLFILSGVYLAKHKSFARGFTWLQQGVGLVIFLYGLICLVGAGLGHSDLQKPLAMEANNEHSTTVIHTFAELQTAVAGAKDKTVLLDFYADWCLSCKVIERNVFQDQEVQQALKSIIMLRIDVTKNDSDAKSIMSQYGVIAPPTMIWLNQEGKQLTSYNIVGEVSKSEFLKTLGQIDYSSKSAPN